MGPHAGLEVADGLASLLGGKALPAHDVVPGLFVDAGGNLSDSPFAGDGFGGAVGVKAPGKRGQFVTLLFGRDFGSYATFEARSDPGTAGTSLPYSVSTAGVVLGSGRVVLVDVFAGAQALLPPPTA